MDENNSLPEAQLEHMHKIIYGAMQAHNHTSRKRPNDE